MNNHAINAHTKSVQYDKIRYDTVDLIHYHIRALGRIRSSLCEKMAEMIACELSPWLCKFYGTTQQAYTSPTAPPPPFEFRVNCKIANIISVPFIHLSPLTYSLPCVLISHHYTCSLRLSNINVVFVPFLRTSLGARSFDVAGPKLWNSFRAAVRAYNCPATFRRHLNTHVFQPVFQSP